MEWPPAAAGLGTGDDKMPGTRNTKVNSIQRVRAGRVTAAGTTDSPYTRARGGEGSALEEHACSRLCTLLTDSCLAVRCTGRRYLGGLILIMRPPKLSRHSDVDTPFRTDNHNARLGLRLALGPGSSWIQPLSTAPAANVRTGSGVRGVRVLRRVREEPVELIVWHSPWGLERSDHLTSRGASVGRTQVEGDGLVLGRAWGREG
mmetsp:Transcript_3108/g.6759  ORF Transcript_3108/g.6759 Transcript_3108/m.6759 type:complete len:204 (-) Transcript_3108:359-970(-)